MLFLVLPRTKKMADLQSLKGRPLDHILRELRKYVANVVAACKGALAPMKKGSGIREELRKVFEIDLDQEREWANVIAIPPTEEERYTAGKAFNDAIPHIEKLTKFYQALQEGLDGICEFGTSAEQNEELRTEMRKYLQNILCYVEFSDFWIRAMNDCSTKENRLKRCKKLEYI